MPRRSAGAIRRERTPARPAGPATVGGEQRQDTREGAFTVRSMPGATAVKEYRCPGCEQEIRAGVAHVVVWPADGDGADRRHWHSSCWRRRSTRGGPGPLPWTGL